MLSTFSYGCTNFVLYFLPRHDCMYRIVNLFYSGDYLVSFPDPTQPLTKVSKSWATAGKITNLALIAQLHDIVLCQCP